MANAELAFFNSRVCVNGFEGRGSAISKEEKIRLCCCSLIDLSN